MNREYFSGKVKVVNLLYQWLYRTLMHLIPFEVVDAQIYIHQGPDLQKNISKNPKFIISFS